MLRDDCYFGWIWLDAQSYNFCNVTKTVNLTIVKLFVNAIQQLLSSSKNANYELNQVQVKFLTRNLTIVKFFINTTEPLLSSDENFDCKLNHS